MASWRDMSTPLDPATAPAPAPAAAAPSSAPSKSGGGWRDQSTPLAPTAPAPAAAAAAPAAASSDPADLGTTAIWNKPDDASWSDFMLAHLAKPFQGAGQATDDYVRTATDAATFGLGDRLASYMGGTDLADERAKTTAAAGRLGIMAPVVDAASYAMGPGELGLAAKIGGKVAPAVGKWAGGVLGSAAEGAGASALGAAGHDEDVGSSALLGGALGAAGGSLGGVVGRGGVLPSAPSADDLTAAAKTAYKPLTNVLYDASKEVHPALDPIDAQNALRDWSGYKWGDASKTSKEINTLLDKPQLSANDLQQSQSYLKGIASDGRSDPNDAMYAAHYAGKLQDVLDNATPQTGVPQNWTNPTGAPSFASAQKAAGDALYGKAQDVGRLNDWIDKAAVPQGPDVGSQASSYLRTGAGQKFAAPGSPQYDALSTLAATSGGAANSAAPSAFDVRHLAHPLVGAAVGGALGVGSQHDFDPAHIAENVILGGTLGYGAHKGIPLIQSALQRAAQGRAIDAARVALGTGAQQSPVLGAAPFRDAVRSLIFGQGAAGRY
jgi:hypothetical protein